MKKYMRKILLISLSVLCCFTVVFAGCNSGGKNSDGASDGISDGTAGGLSGEAHSSGTVISYVSTQTAVYNSTADVVEAVADTVVEISTESVATQWGMQYIVSGAGSGVIVGQSENTYYIITNNHVIDGAEEITVTTRSGVTYSATFLATDDSADLAVVTVSSETTLKVAVWGNSGELKVGEDLIAIGNPLGSLGGTVTKGILSAKGRSIVVGDFNMNLLQTDTAINPGNSGGGLFNMRGELIGVVNAKTTDEEIEGICFAIPADTARSVYTDLVELGYLTGRATLNIEVTLVSGRTQNIICVTDVSGAADGTFTLYDGIYTINGKKITSILDYNVALSEIKPGDSVQIEVYHGKITPSFFGNNISFDSEVTAFTVQARQYGA